MAMNYTPGPYTPFPVSGERSETPPPDFNPSHPFTGVELTVSGLPFTTITSAADHLNQTLQDIVSDGTPMPDLQVVSPSARQPLDFVYVSLSGPLKENPRPDILEQVRVRLDAIDGLEARWKVSSGRSDKTRQAYFEVEESLNPLHVKTRIDNILRQNHHEFQSSYIPNDTSRIFYHFLRRESITALTDSPIRIDGRSYIPRRSRYIQPLFGLEVAINGVGDAQSAKSMIDAYLQRQYGTTSAEPVVRRSRVELDGSVYCVILSTPQLTQSFLRDPFLLFENSGIHPSPPQYLYLLNSNGIPPVSFNNRFASPITIDPSAQRQLDSLSAQCEAMAATVRSLADDQKLLSHNFQTAQDNITHAFADSTAVYAATNLVSTAQAELTSLQQSLTTVQLMSVMAPNPQAQNIILDSINKLTSRIDTATSVRDARAQELRSLQSRSLPMLGHAEIPDLMLQAQDAPMAGPSSDSHEPPSSQSVGSMGPPQKRPRTSTDGQTELAEDVRDANLVASQMLVDSQSMVRFPPSPWPFLSEFAHTHLAFFYPIRAFAALKACMNVYFSFLSSFLTLFSSFPAQRMYNSSSCSPFLMFFLLLFFFFSFLLPSVLALPPVNPVSLRTISLNANGLANPMKIAAIRNMVQTSKPHTFVLGETKNSDHISSRLELNDYDLFESPGRPLNPRGKGKWGVIVGVRRGLFNVQPITVSDKLRGRAVALDLTIPTDHNRGFRHRLIGVYAPWNPGGTLDDENSFWPEITCLCNLSSYSWSLHGDFNATLLASESSSTSLDISASRLAYSHFLTSTDAVDLWRTQPSCDVTRQHTHSTHRTSLNQVPTQSIIDRSAVSRVGTLAGSISILPNFIPSTDHKPIDTRTTLLAPHSLSGYPDIPQETPPSSFSPRFRHPFRSEKERLTMFSSKVDDLLSSHPSPSLVMPISSDAEFQTCYDTFTRVLLSAAKTAFNLPSPHPQVSPKILNPTIKLILRELHHVNRLLSILSRSRHLPHLSFPGEPWVHQYLNAYLAGHPPPADFSTGFKRYLTTIRKNLHKLRFAEERQERERRIDKRSKSRIYQVLHGSSAKRLFPHTISSLPLAITPNPDLEPDLILTGSDAIKDATVSYYQNLYSRTTRPPQDKPWLTSPSVRQISQVVSADPFSWPQTLTIQDLRLLVRRGNARPTPGPDGWEKWFIKYLSDPALGVVLRLTNYIISSSHFPSCLKPTNISTIHKRGPNTILSNYRGIACNNFLLNLPFAWLNHLLTPFLTKHSIIPECQVATQPGTQGRDLISFISQYELWATREHVPLYVLQRDQKKGFDMLEPQGFYDAILAYGLPQSIIDLDHSAQENVPYRIKTAYGFTDTFIVNGVTKQGGSLSPLKCTLTTSLCNRWIADRCMDFTGSISIMSHSARTSRGHTPSDRFQLSLSVIEAMDDSLIPSSDLPSLKRVAAEADRFQATYGWETSWPKSALYVYNTPPPSSEDARMPSVNYSDPQSGSLTWHEVPVITSHTTFLRVPVNKPYLQFSALRDLVLNFSFPPSPRRFPLTVLRRIIVQTLISKLRPHLALQPISHQHAVNLDHLIAQKVHEYLGFPFRFKTLLLSTPLHLRGLGFPSVARINASLSVAGLHRDLNHHLPSFRKMAHISLADWSCQHNHCLNPLLKPYTTSITSPSRQTYIPFAWALAQKVLSRINLSLLPSDLHFLSTGDISLRHLYNQSLHLLPDITRIPTRVLSNFETHNFSLLAHFGHLSISFSSSSSFLFTPFPLSFPSSQYYLTRDFPLLLQWFSSLPSLLHTLSFSQPSLLLSHAHRKSIAEHSIIALATQSTSFPHKTPPLTFATDASHISPTSQSHPSTTFAVVANNNAFTASLSQSHSTTILHGEAYAIAAASVLARLHSQPITIHTDHLNSIRLLSASPSSLSLKTNPARSIYRWILDIWSTMPHKPILTHVRAHTTSLSLPSQLNRLADHLASTSNSLFLPPPAVPLPTFFMDTFIPFSTTYGFIESNLFSFCNAQLSSLDAASLDTFHEPRPSSSCFDDTPPPSYPYFKAPSSYSLTVQLYLRSGQLDTSLSCASRLKDDCQPWCRFGCPTFEDPHHIFLSCPRFSSLRDARASELTSNVGRILQSSSIPPADRTLILDRLCNLFQDSDAWPAGRSLYYLGILPPFFPHTLHCPQIHTRLAHECHTVSIRLAAQIWATARCAAYSKSHPPTRSRSSVVLPSLLARILPPSLSYPSFSISFS